MEKNYYDRYWSRHQDHYQDRLKPPDNDEKINQNITEQFRPFLNGRVLDYGVGEGHLMNKISKLPNVESVVGADISPVAISNAKRFYPQHEFCLIQDDCIQLANETVDTIYCNQVMEHILDVVMVAKECYRVLKPGGKFLITTTDYNWLKKVFISAFIFDTYFSPKSPHIRAFTKKTLHSILKEAGFRLHHYEWDGSYYGLMPRGQFMVVQK